MENFELSVSRFDEFAEEFSRQFVSVEAYADSLDWFCSRIKNARPKILELGCGPGNVTRFLKNRFPESRITAVDLAPKMIQIARKALPGVDFRVMDVREVSTIDEKYDAILCAFCLPFLSKQDTAKLISDCADLLVEGGVIYLSTMEGDEHKAGFETTSFSGNSEIFFNYHLQQDLETVLIQSGFVIDRIKLQDYSEPDGSITTDMIFVALKNS